MREVALPSPSAWPKTSFALGWSSNNLNSFKRSSRNDEALTLQTLQKNNPGNTNGIYTYLSHATSPNSVSKSLVPKRAISQVSRTAAICSYRTSSIVSVVVDLPGSFLVMGKIYGIMYWFAKWQG